MHNVDKQSNTDEGELVSIQGIKDLYYDLILHQFS